MNERGKYLMVAAYNAGTANRSARNGVGPAAWVEANGHHVLAAAPPPYAKRHTIHDRDKVALFGTGIDLAEWVKDELHKAGFDMTKIVVSTYDPEAEVMRYSQP